MRASPASEVPHRRHIRSKLCLHNIQNFWLASRVAHDIPAPLVGIDRHNFTAVRGERLLEHQLGGVCDFSETVQKEMTINSRLGVCAKRCEIVILSGRDGEAVAQYWIFIDVEGFNVNARIRERTELEN